MRNENKIWVREYEGKKPPGRPRHRWDDNIKLDCRETLLEGVDCIRVDQFCYLWLALVNTERTIRFMGNFLTS
jgi:hypothetical protein